MKILFLQPDAVRREFEFVEEVSSLEELMKFFNSFDWEKGNKIIAKQKSLDLPCFPQTLRFERSETDYVEVCPSKGNEEYCLSCVNGKLVLDIIVSGEIDRQPVSIKEFLQDFWSQNLKEKYTFEEASESEKADLVAGSNFSISLLWPAIFLIIASVIIVNGKGEVHRNTNFLLLVTAISCVIFSPYFLLLAQYFKYNGNTTLSIRKKEKTLTIIKKGDSRTISFKDITKSRILINDTRSYKALTKGWGYLILEIGPKERIVITNFLYKDFESIASLLFLNPIMDSSRFPIITLRIKSDKDLVNEKNEFDSKVQEFMENWSTKSKDDLMKIKQNPREYADYAVEAAKRLLKR